MLAVGFKRRRVSFPANLKKGDLDKMAATKNAKTQSANSKATAKTTSKANGSTSAKATKSAKNCK